MSLVVAVRLDDGGRAEAGVGAVARRAAGFVAAAWSGAVAALHESELAAVFEVRAGASATPQAAWWSNGRVTVALDGYLASEQPRVAHAERVGAAYLRAGPSGVEELDGAFVIVLFDCRTRCAFLWSDRAATRPLFYAEAGGFLVAAPLPGACAAVPGFDGELEPGSLAAMALNGALLDENTYYRSVRLAGPARRVEVGRTGTRVERYWIRRFVEGPQPDAGEFGEVVTDAVIRHVRRFERPILALSGGLDSRILLAAARRRNLELPAIVWGFDQVDDARGDFCTAQQAAQRAGVALCSRRIDVDALPACAESVVRMTDGLTGHLGNFTEGDAVARELSAEYDALLRGDEMFGWAMSVNTPQEALRRVGVNVGKRLKLLRFLLRRDRAEAVLADYRRQQDALLASCEARQDANDLKDELYWRTRFPRLIASQAAVFRPHLDVVCPLLDRLVLDLIGRLKRPQRIDKRYAAACAQELWPEQFELPLNAVHSRTSWRRRLRELGQAQRYLVEVLLEPQAEFDAWFDRTAVRAWLVYATAEGARAPWPAGSGAFRRTAAVARAFLLKPTFKERVVINLATLKLWMAGRS